ncbi:bifunctional 2-polyprenyl-6-hydroxyphenol methylase/3-demethylubiquinol 3-O-methyltransferase UbiG [Bosea sp. (in: a-proteobacteria)]|uniref:class I SAM-dependent methyltransferase n=1 Tax=Bosea sp. (in: a-proteobacteria) TaxID=1871050 RepID=UPI00262B99A5|nr:class I SAM-dependent methyltransferase [Bosea sp. (in: a-proteobacteria)]MCO5090673.1 class I SAM-dependent methyltransferase [Bosea sp. (in: a-proteobacteria)]
MFSWLKRRRPTRDKAQLSDDIARFIESSGLRADSEREARNFLSYLDNYRKPETIAAYHYVLEPLFEGGLGKRPRRILDYGCWYGLSSVMMARLGAEVVGVDINPVALERGTGMLRAMGEGGVTLRHCNDFLTRPESFRSDLVVIMDVLCSANPDDHPKILAAAHAALVPDGWLLISDANNLRNRDVVEMLQARWRDYEIGRGTIDAPAGDYHQGRRAFIAGHLPAADGAVLDRLARESCYLWGDELLAQVSARMAGTGAASRFGPEGLVAPVRADDGCTFGTAIDPLKLVGMLREMGMAVEMRRALAGDPVPRDEEEGYADPHYFIVARAHSGRRG